MRFFDIYIFLSFSLLLPSPPRSPLPPTFGLARWSLSHTQTLVYNKDSNLLNLTKKKTFWPWELRKEEEKRRNKKNRSKGRKNWLNIEFEVGFKHSKNKRKFFFPEFKEVKGKKELVVFTGAKEGRARLAQVLSFLTKVNVDQALV